MSKTGMRRGILRVGFVVLIAVASLNAIVLNCVAGQFYTKGYDQCVNSSGHSGIWSVVNYACVKATEKNQNACASWLGSANDSTSNVIVANATSGTISVKIWGMCTDYSNKSTRMDIWDDGGSISCGNSCNFERSGDWGRPSFKSATLNIANFISGAMQTTVNGQLAYYRMVMVNRQHGGNSSSGMDFSPIYLVVGGQQPQPTPTPTPSRSICSAWGNPPTYDNSNENDGTTSIDIRIRNTASRFRGAGLGDWNNGTIYAMPTDVIAWHTCYWPGVQATHATEISSLGNGGDWRNWTRWNNYELLSTTKCEDDKSVGYSLVRDKVPEAPWASKNSNSFFLSYSDADAGDRGLMGPYAIGDTKVRYADNSKTTYEGAAGDTYTETARTDKPVYVHIETKNPTEKIYGCPCCPSAEYTTCDDPDDEDGDGDKKCHCDDPKTCYCCTNKYTSELKNAHYFEGELEDSVSVQVPYNFFNTTRVVIKKDEAYAGETVKVDDVKVTVGQIWNGVTLESYATEVLHPKVKLFAYGAHTVDSDSYRGKAPSDAGCGDLSSVAVHGCIELGTASRNQLNASGSLLGSEESFSELAGEYNVFDISAGDYMCFVSAVYPAQSNGYTDMSSGNGKWRYSYPTCVAIAKRPTFQVWGGDMYTNSTIKAATAKKRNVYNDYRDDMKKFTVKNGSPTYYGSWAEEGVVIGVSGGINNDGNDFAFASGAALGYRDKLEKANTGVDGSLDCPKIAPLTIANSGGSCGYPSHIESEFVNDNSDIANEKRRELIDYWVKSTQDHTASGATIRYYNTINSVGNVTVPRKETWIYDVNGDFTITGNIKYEDGYDANSTLRDIPKVVIYADNVKIQCNVKRVDAIIITKVGGKVDTCYKQDLGDDDDPDRRDQLKIFGMVITDDIILGRTYGSAAWKGEKCSSVNNDLNKDRYDPRCNGQLAAAEVFDFDSSILLWSEFMASAAETDTMQVVYQNEIAPRY